MGESFQDFLKQSQNTKKGRLKQITDYKFIALSAASQLPGRGSTDVDDAPVPAC